MRVMMRGWVLIGLLMAALLSAPVHAQVALTTVADTVYSASGAPAQGSVVVSWTGFTTAAGNVVAAGTTSATLGANGSLSVALAPNAGATPTGSYYTVVFHLSDGTTSKQYWVVPAGGGPVTIASVQNQVLPTSVAMQTVSKAYVDTAIAAAVSTGTKSAVVTTSSSSYVQKTGDTMTGPLVLPADPVSPLQAADKHYVDVNIAALGGGSATKVSTLPSASQTVVQPAGTQLEVNDLNGVLDATGFLTAGGSNGIGNALGSGNCTSGCDVSVSVTYPGSDSLPMGGLASGIHLEDHRGGASFEVTENPLPATGATVVSRSIVQTTTRSAQEAHATRQSSGADNMVLDLTHNALTGGSNQFPGDAEAQVPYGKSNYGIIEMVGNYHTQGQHVQFNNAVNCYSVGDCLAGGQFIRSSGGYRDQADEGTHPFDLQVAEDWSVFQGTCDGGCTQGSTSVHVNMTGNPGTQGDGRFLMDTAAGKVVSTGLIAGNGGDYFPIVNFSGTNFPVSVQLILAAPALSQANNLAPGTVTLPIDDDSGSLHSPYSTSTAALPATTGVACIADQGLFPYFEMANYTVVDAKHVQLTLNKVHKVAAIMAVGGMCGYGLEQVADTQGSVRQIFPVMGSPTPTQVYYAPSETFVAGISGPSSTGAYLNESSPIASATRSGNVVTLNLAQSLPYDMNGLTMTVSGAADPSYNGTFQVTTTGGASLTYTANGADGSTTGGTVSFNNGKYAMYPMAEVLSVYNPQTASVDGTFTLAPNTVAWSPGDTVEEPHYYQQQTYADQELVTQYVPRPTMHADAGKVYNGQLGPGARGWTVVNNVAASNYLGAGGTHQVPDSAFLSSGPWRNSIEVDAGTESVLRIHCNLNSCSRWDSGYALFSMDRNNGMDFLTYSPQNSSATWVLGGQYFTFSPSGFSAPSVSTSSLNFNGVALTNPSAGQLSLTSSVQPIGATLTATNQNAGTAIPIAAYCPNATASNPCLFPIGTAFAPNSVGILAWQPSGFFQMQTYNNNSPIQIGGSAINTTASLMVNNGAAVNQLGNTCGANISLCVNPAATMTVDANGNIASPAYHETLHTPASSSEGCRAGDFTDDANFHYVCVASNTWKRVALNSF